MKWSWLATLLSDHSWGVARGLGEDYLRFRKGLVEERVRFISMRSLVCTCNGELHVISENIIYLFFY